MAELQKTNGIGNQVKLTF